jgi:hypothetical protein
VCSGWELNEWIYIFVSMIGGRVWVDKKSKVNLNSDNGCDSGNEESMVWLGFATERTFD